MDFKSRALSQSGDTEDTQRQRLATAITIGLLNYLASDGVSGGLTVEVEQTAQPGQAGPATDPWNFWVMSLQGSIAMTGEESSRELDLSADLGADRITDDWKITIGARDRTQREDFDLDEDEPLRAIRNERDFDGLVARSLNDHWSVGGRGEHRFVDVREHRDPRVLRRRRSNTTSFRIRSTRAGSCASATPSARIYARYREETLLFTMSDTMAQQQASVTIDQREPWGSLQAELEYSTFLPDASLYRIQLEGDVNVRLARGLSLSIEGSDEPDPRSDFDSSPGRDARGGAAPPSPPAQRLRVQPADRPDLYVRVDLQHDRESAVRQ